MNMTQKIEGSSREPDAISRPARSEGGSNSALTSLRNFVKLASLATLIGCSDEPAANLKMGRFCGQPAEVTSEIEIVAAPVKEEVPVIKHQKKVSSACPKKDGPLTPTQFQACLRKMGMKDEDGDGDLDVNDMSLYAARGGR